MGRVLRKGEANTFWVALVCDENPHKLAKKGTPEVYIAKNLDASARITPPIARDPHGRYWITLSPDDCDTEGSMTVLVKMQGAREAVLPFNVCGVGEGEIVWSGYRGGA